MWLHVERLTDEMFIVRYSNEYRYVQAYDFNCVNYICLLKLSIIKI